MPINKFLYFGDFAAIPIAVLLFFYLALAARGLAATPELAISLFLGLALWTLVEYLIHRFVYHHAPILSPLHNSITATPTR